MVSIYVCYEEIRLKFKEKSVIYGNYPSQKEGNAKISLWGQRRLAMGAKAPVKRVGLGTMTLDRQGRKHETSKLQTSKRPQFGRHTDKPWSRRD